LKIIHSYYQRLKHPWIERMDAAEEDIAREGAERDDRQAIAKQTGISEEAIAAARAEALASVAGPIAFRQRDVRAGGNADVGKALETPAEARKRLATEFRVLAAGNNRLAEAEATLKTLSSQCDTVALLRLKELILAEGSLAHEKLAAAAGTRTAVRRKTQVREDIAVGAKSLETLLKGIPAMLAEQFRDRLAEIQETAQTGDAEAALQEFSLLQRAVTEAAATGESAHKLVRALEALGYKQIGAMETLRASDIQGVDLRIPGYQDRVMEVRWDAKKEALSTEVVRTTESTGAPAQIEGDKKAQAKSCSDLKAALAAIENSRNLKLAREQAPGVKMKYRPTAGTSQKKVTAQRQQSQRAP
jgi:hypothetical protein